MRALLTGCAGFIGVNVLKSLLRQKWDVIGIDNLSGDDAADRLSLALSECKDKSRFKGHRFDLSKTMAMGEEFKADVCIHLAAVAGVPQSINAPEKSFESNERGFFNVLNRCQKTKTPLIFASSSSVHGKDGELQSPYALNKKHNEDWADMYAKQYGLNYCGLRFFNVFGDHQSTRAVIPKFIHNAKNKKSSVVYNKNTQRDFTHVANVVAAINLAAFHMSVGKKVVQETFDIGMGGSVSLAELAEHIKSKFGGEFIYQEGSRRGDILTSKADVDPFIKKFGDFRAVSFEQGLEKMREATIWG